jgi:hypothetical protein
MNCQCQSCLEILNREPSDSFTLELQTRLIDGSVIHIDTAPDGKPIYRQW